MIKVDDNARTARLAVILDRIIGDYVPPGKILGTPNPNPDLSEKRVRELIQCKKDILVAEDVYGYFILKTDQHEGLLDLAAKGLFPSNELVSISGRFHYPPNKGYMGWHTNSNMEGWRFYATCCDEDKKSFFRYYQNGKIVTEWEKKGWNFRAFQVKQDSLYWHCVYSETNRYSFGFRFK